MAVIAACWNRTTACGLPALCRDANCSKPLATATTAPCARSWVGAAAFCRTTATAERKKKARLAQRIGLPRDRPRGRATSFYRSTHERKSGDVREELSVL